MIKFFTSRELSDRLGIKLAKWKRWSREFLPPDPLGGMQSGYARQYNPDQAFTVFLGGHLVADLKFSIPEAKRILQDLQGWLSERGFYFYSGGSAKLNEGVNELVERYVIFIERNKGPENQLVFIYTIRGIIATEPVHYKGFEIMKELYLETSIGTQPETFSAVDMHHSKPFNISMVLDHFVKSVDLDSVNYPALHSSNARISSVGIGK
jgi:hypothetical protein